jgi:hypothetical protein
MGNKRLPQLTHNLISISGAVVALIAGFIIVFLLIINAMYGIRNPYMGIVLYMVLPLLLIAGLLFIPLGMYFRWRKAEKHGEISNRKWPYIDLENKRHRNAALIFIAGTLLFVMISAVGIYQAYHYTDSVRFCGLTCHTVMKPEYTTHEHSPHARVACVQCHIGPGAEWYAKSKLRGLYQVYAVLADVYPRPITSPITALRPARAICEQCHWPQHFFGAQQRKFNHYLYDRSNTHWSINMLVKVGGSNSRTPAMRDIHWHMSPEITIEYIATDRRRQQIPWVRVKNGKTGETVVFEDPSSMPSRVKSEDRRVMDCLDCHNRPTHNFLSPDTGIDLAIFSGRIDSSIPYIKRAAVKAISKDYASMEQGRTGIATEIESFFGNKFPEYYKENRGKILEAIDAAGDVFSKNIFPAMNARWSSYPNNIGHFLFRGCMRCHDGKHKSRDDAVIKNGCHTCHSILSQGKEGADTIKEIDIMKGLEFRHPVEIGDAWKNGTCYECHNGTEP